MYVQAISAYAPHPNAAKLWMEYLYSDVGQNTWLNGYCNPIRYDGWQGGDGRSRPPRRKLPESQRHGLPDPRPDQQPPT